MTKNNNTVIDLLPHQHDFIFSQFTHTGLIGGYGSAKTFAGVMKTVVKKLAYPGIPVAYYLPTYGLVKDIAFIRFAEILDLIGVPYVLDQTDYEFSTPYGKILMRSMMNPDRIVGYEVGYSCVDETDILPEKSMNVVFAQIVGRNRAKLPDGSVNQTDIVGTPEGFKFAYNFLVRNTKPNRKIIKAKTIDNPFLPDGYIDTLKTLYTPEQLEAYLNGEFINLTTGNVYRRFDRKRNHSGRIARPNDILHIGQDFNITKMNAVIHTVDEVTALNIEDFKHLQNWELLRSQVLLKDSARIKTAVDEIANAYDTPEIIGLVQQKYPDHRVIMYPDASGANRSSSGRSDIDLLKDAKFVVRALRKNPFVKDRVNAVNMAFLDVIGNTFYYVNTDRCPVYTEALEKQTYKNGEPDKSSGYDHITEAAGYFIYYDSKPTSSTWGKSTQV
jgi:hypothetical protein